MSRELIIRPKAEKDLADAYAWYETKVEGLGIDFIRRADAAFMLLAAIPTQASSTIGIIAGFCYAGFRMVYSMQ